MNRNQRLRISALNDLQRFCPDAHYWLREHSPQADLELSNIVLANPGSLRPTLRELDAAQALSYFAQYEIRSRAIWDKINPVMDATAPRPEPSEEEERARADGDREIAARLEVFRIAALTYARTVGDTQLIEGFQPLPPVVQPVACVGEAVGASNSTSASTASWKDAARNIADQLDEADNGAGARSSIKDMADRVAEIMAKEKILGPHGQLSGGNILREALQGANWTRKAYAKDRGK